MAWGDLQLELRKNRTLAVISIGALLLIVGPSVAFDVAYGRAMQQNDAREVVREDLRKLIGEAPAKIGIFHFGPYFYTVMPAAKPLNSQKVAVQLQDPGEDASFFLVGFPSQISPAQINATVAHVEAQGKFQYERSYHVPIKIFGHEFKVMRFPQDMTYPFPTILLFRAAAST
jgi:hypothetical protein